MSTELLACPFGCGDQGQVVTFDDSNIARHCVVDRWYVRCISCEAETASYDSENDAVAAWNRRTPPTATPRMEVTEDAVERLAKHNAKIESQRFKTLDGVLLHQANWRRLIPEARAALSAALSSGEGE